MESLNTIQLKAYYIQINKDNKYKTSLSNELVEAGVKLINSILTNFHYLLSNPQISVGPISYPVKNNLSKQELDSFVKYVAYPFIKSNYDIIIKLPYLDSNNIYPGIMQIGLPGTLNSEEIIKLK